MSLASYWLLAIALADAALLDGAVEPDPLQDLVHELGHQLGDEVADQQDDQEAEQLGDEGREGREAFADRGLDVEGERGHAVRLLGLGLPTAVGRRLRPRCPLPGGENADDLAPGHDVVLLRFSTWCAPHPERCVDQRGLAGARPVP
jgi:hypothetical protein